MGGLQPHRRQTVEAGQDEGLEAPGAWPGLGELPEGLPEDFRTVQSALRRTSSALVGDSSLSSYTNCVASPGASI